MSDDITNELLRGLPPEDPAFWDRVDSSLSAIEAERAERSPAFRAAPSPEDAPSEPEVIELDLRREPDPSGASRLRPLAAAAAVVVVLAIGWAVLSGDDGRPTETADGPAQIDDAAPASTVVLTGAEILADAERRDAEPIDTGFGPSFELVEDGDRRSMSIVANMFFDDPEILRFDITELADLTVELTSIEETTVLRLVSPTGELVIDARAPHTETIDLDETGTWALILEAVDRSDRLTLDLVIENSQ